VPLTDQRGLQLGGAILPANEKEDKPLADLPGTAAEVVIADKGFGAAATPAGSPPPAPDCSRDKTRTLASEHALG
jgi:hypothetical protein